MSVLKIVINVSKGSLLTGNAWADVLLGGIRVVDKFPIIEPFNFDPNLVKPTQIEIIQEYDDMSVLTLTVINNPESIGPIQTYSVEFFLNDQSIGLNWQTAIKSKPLRFGGQPDVIITNPHVDDPKFKGWCSVPNISPGMSITWGLQDLVVVQ